MLCVQRQLSVPSVSRLSVPSVCVGGGGGGGRLNDCFLSNFRISFILFYFIFYHFCIVYSTVFLFLCTLMYCLNVVSLTVMVSGGDSDGVWW